MSETSSESSLWSSADSTAKECSPIRKVNSAPRLDGGVDEVPLNEKLGHLHRNLRVVTDPEVIQPQGVGSEDQAGGRVLHRDVAEVKVANGEGGGFAFPLLGRCPRKGVTTKYCLNYYNY